MAKLSLVEPKVPSALATLADDFLADCRARGLSVRTVQAYDYPITHIFLPWCTHEGIAEPSQLTAALAGRFTTKLLEDGGKDGPLSRASVRSYVRSVRVFLGWAGGAEGGAEPQAAQGRETADRRPQP